jgi:hypothetical protein
VFTAVGTGLELLTKLGSYFQSNYGYGQVDVDVSPDLTSAAVVQSFAAWPTPPKFIVPSHSLASDPRDVLELLRPLHMQYSEWVSNREIAVKYAEGHKDKNKAAAAACEGAAAAYLKSITAYETFISGLTADVQGGEPVGVRVVRQKKLQKLLDAKPLILLLTPNEAAAYYTKKNLWTFLGGMPIYTMGGTSVTYSLFESGSERELTYGVVAHHGGYRALNQVERVVNASAAGGGYDARR